MVLADEINRATPRTQSSLLEAMEEHQITVDGVTKKLEEPFFVMATENPLESYSTFPLPDAQVDRFFMQLSLGYMTREQEMQVLARPSAISILDTLQQVVTAQETAYVRSHYQELSLIHILESFQCNIPKGKIHHRVSKFLLKFSVWINPKQDGKK